jgi:outer membrane lipase/esterase
VLAQIQGFSGTLSPQGLTVLWAGPNDIFTAIFSSQDPSAVIQPAVDNLAQAIATLYAAGATTILVPDMPNLGHTPLGLGLGPATSALLTALSARVQRASRPEARAARGHEAGLDIVEFDTFALLDAVIANPVAYGFTNVTDPCFNGVSFCANPGQYLFWDILHPTAAAHQILGNAFALARA